LILSLVQTKGGTGKSTLSQCLAFSTPFRKAFASIALVEMDEQATLRRWWEARLERKRAARNVVFHFVPAQDQDELRVAMERLLEEHDLLLLDVPGESVSRFATSFACAISDFALIPMRTSTNDEDAFELNLLPIIEQIERMNPDKREIFHVLPAFTHPRANKRNLVDYFRQILPEGVRCLDAAFPYRAMFENFNRMGLNLQEYGRLVKNNRREYKQAKNAERDIDQIAKAILDRLPRDD